MLRDVVEIHSIILEERGNSRDQVWSRHLPLRRLVVHVRSPHYVRTCFDWRALLHAQARKRDIEIGAVEGCMRASDYR